jgi:hypothetical protein
MNRTKQRRALVGIAVLSAIFLAVSAVSAGAQRAGPR